METRTAEACPNLLPRLGIAGVSPAVALQVAVGITLPMIVLYTGLVLNATISGRIQFIHLGTEP